MRKYFRRLIERLRAGVPGSQRGEPSIRDGSPDSQQTRPSPQG
jgi:hypothetical protein